MSKCLPCIKPIPAVYDGCLSVEEQVCKLNKAICELVELINTFDEIYATIDQLNESQNEQTSYLLGVIGDTKQELLALVESEVLKLKQLIEDAIAGQVLIFDPTYGIEPRKVDRVVRNVYHWLRYYADYAQTLDSLQLTAKTRDNYQLTAKVFDLYSMLYYSKNELPQPAPTDEYVKKHDILAYYFERI